MKRFSPLLRLAVVLAVFLLDRGTKWWAQAWLLPRSPIELASFLHLTYLENTGAAFGMLRGSNGLLAIVSAGLLAILARLARRHPPEDLWAHWGLALVAGGALGNLYDRLAYGFVVDFLDFRIWPVFNAADSCISIGAACLALGLRGRRS